MGDKKDGKIALLFYISIFAILLVISMASAGISEWLKNIQDAITGKATQSVSMNISVGGPKIIFVYNSTLTGFASGPNEAPAVSGMIINFTAYSVAGASNLNSSSATINITGDATRQNSSCSVYQSGGNYANYTCNVTMFWWDGTGVWSITAHIKDNQTNSAVNTTTSFYVGERTAFVMSPASLTWPGIAPGATNQTSNNDPLLLNNTGNDIIDAGNIAINASNLRGEATSTLALWANNFSIRWSDGGTPPAECGGNVMNRTAFVGITTANLTKGNYTINDGNTGQENLYFCLRLIGSELTTQAYSTANEAEHAWIVRIL